MFYLKLNEALQYNFNQLHTMGQLTHSSSEVMFDSMTLASPLIHHLFSYSEKNSESVSNYDQLCEYWNHLKSQKQWDSMYHGGFTAIIPHSQSTSLPTALP